jgi:hypothetical protein
MSPSTIPDGVGMENDADRTISDSGDVENDADRRRLGAHRDPGSGAPGYTRRSFGGGATCT